MESHRGPDTSRTLDDVAGASASLEKVLSTGNKSESVHALIDCTWEGREVNESFERDAIPDALKPQTITRAHSGSIVEILDVLNNIIIS